MGDGTPDLIQQLYFHSPRTDDRLAVKADEDGTVTITLERLAASRPEVWKPFTQLVIPAGQRVTFRPPRPDQDYGKVLFETIGET